MRIATFLSFFLFNFFSVVIVYAFKRIDFYNNPKQLEKCTGKESIVDICWISWHPSVLSVVKDGYIEIDTNETLCWKGWQKLTQFQSPEIRCHNEAPSLSSDQAKGKEEWDVLRDLIKNANLLVLHPNFTYERSEKPRKSFGNSNLDWMFSNDVLCLSCTTRSLAIRTLPICSSL